MYANMPRSENESSAITQIALAQPEISWRRRRSLRTVMSSQNQTTKTNIAKTSTRKLRKVKPSAKKSIAILLIHWTGLFAGVANSLRRSCCLRRSSNHCRGNSNVSPPVPQRTHAFTGCIFSRETRGKLSRTPHGESAAGGFDMRCPRRQLWHTIIFFVHALQCSGEYLLALQGMFCDAGKARLSAFPCRALRGASRGPRCVPCRACHAGAGATP